jgi:hypothetical protein
MRTTHRTCRASCVAAIALALCPSAHAQSRGPREGWFLRNQTSARYNPVGLFDEVRLGYRARLSDADSGLLRDTYVAVAANASASPIFARAGVSLEVQPVSFLNLSVVYEGGGYLGTLGSVQSLPSAASASFTDADIAARGGLSGSNPARGYAAPMHQLILGAFPQVRYRWLSVRSNNRFVYQAVALRPGDRVFYDANWDVLFPNEGWLYVNDVDVLVEPVANLRVGARYNLTHAFYADAHFAPGEAQNAGANATTQRLGPIASYTFPTAGGGGFGAPTLSLVLNWWLQHPYRTGGSAPGATSQAIPYVGAAFSFRFDL